MIKMFLVGHDRPQGKSLQIIMFNQNSGYTQSLHKRASHGIPSPNTHVRFVRKLCRKLIKIIGKAIGRANGILGFITNAMLFTSFIQILWLRSIICCNWDHCSRRQTLCDVFRKDRTNPSHVQHEELCSRKKFSAGGGN